MIFGEKGCLNGKHGLDNLHMNKQLSHNAQLIINSLGDLNSRFSGKSILITGGAGFLGVQFMLLVQSKPRKHHVMQHQILWK